MACSSPAVLLLLAALAGVAGAGDIVHQDNEFPKIPGCNNDFVLDDPVCVATRKDGKKVVTENWVEDNFELGELIDAERASLASLPAFYTAALSLNKIHERRVSFVGISVFY